MTLLLTIGVCGLSVLVILHTLAIINLEDGVDRCRRIEDNNSSMQFYRIQRLERLTESLAEIVSVHEVTEKNVEKTLLKELKIKDKFLINMILSDSSPEDTEKIKNHILQRLWADFEEMLKDHEYHYDEVWYKKYEEKKGGADVDDR